MTELSGSWRAAPTAGDLALGFTDPEFDDRAWETIPVPGHWRSVPAFADCDGPLLHRTRFTTPGTATGPSASIDVEPAERRWWLVFDGIFYESDVWLDGTYLGDTEGYFFPHGFDVTEHLADRREHVLGVEVGCSPPGDRTRKRNITGVFQHWDCLDPAWNPGGIWRPVRVESSGAVRIRHFRALCQDASSDSATLFLRAVIDTTTSDTVDLVTSIEAPGTAADHVETRPLAAGENRVEWTVTVPEPPLWWPHTLGDQPLGRIEVAARLADGRVSDRRHRSIGFRTVKLDDWRLEINGERLFVKGSNQGPARMALADATADELAGDVDRARQANLDMLRVHGHVSRPELYDAADREGLLLWQDFPLQWGYSRSIRRQARRQTREAVDLLAHHPSIALWCGHNEPLALDVDPEILADPAKTRRIAVRGALAMFLPTWNKTVLDHSIRRVFERNDPSRPVVPHSGVLPHPPQMDGTDSHLYAGWYHGEERDFPRILRRWPRLARFVSEFGAQAVPDNAEFCRPDRWPDLDWEHLARRHGLQKTRFDVYVPPADHDSFEEWREATQRYQAGLITSHVEALRRIKYRPTGGFLQFCFADSYPCVSWSVLDHGRAPKAGLEALRRACAPVVVVADRPPAEIGPGQDLRLDVHVVSDRRDELAGGRVSARLTGPDGTRSWEWAGTVPADSCAYVGTVRGTTPERPGDLTHDLTFTCGEVRAANRYTSRVTAPSTSRDRPSGP